MSDSDLRVLFILALPEPRFYYSASMFESRTGFLDAGPYNLLCGHVDQWAPANTAGTG